MPSEVDFTHARDEMVSAGSVDDRSRLWATATWLVTGAGVVMIVWMLSTNALQMPPVSTRVLVTAMVVVLSYGMAGAVLIDRRPDLVFGWLLAAVAVTQVIAVGASTVAFDAWQTGSTGPMVRLGGAATTLLFLPVAVQGIVNVRFPSGRPTSRASRALELAIIASTTLALVGGAILGASVADLPTTTSTPFDDLSPDSGFGRLGLVLQTLVPMVVLLGLVAGIGVVVRYRKAHGIERQQLKWRAVGVLAALALFPFAVAEVTGWIDALDPLLFVFTLAIPVLRYRLWSIDTLVRRSVVYAVVTVTLVGMYIALTWLGSGIVSERVGASVAAVAVALAFAPLRTRVQGMVDRVAYGGRRDPYRTISDLDRRLGEVAAPGQVLPAIVETIGISLRLPFVAVDRADGSRLATYGIQEADVERWALVFEGADEGVLIAQPRRGEDEFDKRDRKLLADVAIHAGAVVHAETVTADLIASRQRLVTTREEERRRLRRDLHDGLGPTLTSIGLNLDAARAQLRADPNDAERLVQDAKTATTNAIAEVRRLVYGLRPPALDNLGFLGAIQHQMEQLSNNSCRVTLDAENLPALPAAVEVAAYRTVVEAVTNSIRHGHAHDCTVRLRVDSGTLTVEVQDDGTPSATWTPGVGLLSMREQAAELGGNVSAGPSEDGGALVSARYPLLDADT